APARHHPQAHEVGGRGHGARAARAPRGGDRHERGRLHLVAAAEPGHPQAYSGDGRGEAGVVAFHRIEREVHEGLRILEILEVLEEGSAAQARVLRRATRWRGRITAANGTSPGRGSPRPADPRGGAARYSSSSSITPAGATTTSGSRSAMH